MDNKDKLNKEVNKSDKLKKVIASLLAAGTIVGVSGNFTKADAAGKAENYEKKTMNVRVPKKNMGVKLETVNINGKPATIFKSGNVETITIDGEVKTLSRMGGTIINSNGIKMESVSIDGHPYTITSIEVKKGLDHIKVSDEVKKKTREESKNYNKKGNGKLPRYNEGRERY